MSTIIATALGGLLALGTFVILYRVYLSPLRHIPGPGFAAVTRFWFTNTFAETNPKRKMELTRHIAPGYTMTNLLQGEQAIDADIALLLDWLDRFAESGEPIKLGDYLRFATNDIVGDIAYVSVMGFFRWVHVLLVANPVVTWLNLVPWGHILNIAKQALEDRQKNPDGRYDVSAHWFRALAESPGGRMRRHEIDSAAFNAISAATDTVAATIQAFVYYLMRHPNVCKRVQSEMAAAGLEDRVVSYADAQGLRVLQACIKETLRLFGPVTMGFPRVAPKGGITIGDQTFPEGTTLSIHPWVIHLSKEIWGEDAREFNPDRWFGDDVARLEKHFIPFSLGYESCPGQNLGRIELSKICATLIRSYEFRQVEPEQEMEYQAYFGLTAHMPACYVRKTDNNGGVQPSAL
ncbi:hypothetical protein PG991_001720 [Apiospora marii]|uniref:Cytochrome P450 n=1 Tax=Apiospora marii TaxID=335849 RepID=A0ABR1SQH3_9PEZI